MVYINVVHDIYDQHDKIGKVPANILKKPTIKSVKLT